MVLPVFRNRETLRELHGRLSRVMEAHGLRYQLLYVDDACPAGSLEVLRELAAADPAVGVVALARNVGQQRAVMAGLRHAGGAAVVVMDADLQDPPEAISRLLAELGQGWGAVFAGRRGRYESAARLFTSRLFKKLLHHLCGVPADAGIYVAMSREMVQRLLAFEDPNPFVVAMIGCTGLPTVSIPVERAVRASGKSAYSSWKRIRVGTLAVARVFLWKSRGNRPPSRRKGRTECVRSYYGCIGAAGSGSAGGCPASAGTGGKGGL